MSTTESNMQEKLDTHLAKSGIVKTSLNTKVQVKNNINKTFDDKFRNIKDILNTNLVNPKLTAPPSNVDYCENFDYDQFA